MKVLFIICKLVICSCCKEQYIGKTKAMPMERLKVCRQHICHEEYYQIKDKEYLRICGKSCF